MSDQKIYTAIGTMSGTSADGIDVAVIKTDGRDFVEPQEFYFMPYTEEMQKQIRNAYNTDPKDEHACKNVKILEDAITRAHFFAISNMINDHAVKREDIDVIGFHGQTIAHDPDNGMTWQIGQGDQLADYCEIDVVSDFRTADVEAGGQGAPLVPIYHAALAASVKKPCAIINIGGIANMTFIPKTGVEDMLAFDTGPGNALIDDWMRKRSIGSYDTNGETAAMGKVNEGIVSQYMAHPYFDLTGAKSLDRNAFSLDPVSMMGLEDGAATLTAFTVESIVKAISQCPDKPKSVIVTGGGRYNQTIMNGLRDKLSCDVKSSEHYGFNGDAMEAEAFAYLAVRHMMGLPYSFKGTTGVSVPVCGGKYHKYLETEASA